jgi:hypothetical protein
MPCVRRLLAGPRGLSYLGAAGLVATAACSRPPVIVVPVAAFAPLSADSFRAVAARTVPGGAQLLAIHWQYDDGTGPVGGRGAVRVVPPDSLRLDVGIAALGRATLVIAGDSIWAEPEAMAREVLPDRAIIWAMLGVVRAPDDPVRIEVGEAADRRLYRLVASGGVSTMLEMRGDTLLGGTMVRGDKAIGRLVLTRDAGGAVVRAEATDRERGVRFAMQVDRREASGVFPSEIWRRP